MSINFPGPTATDTITLGISDSFLDADFSFAGMFNTNSVSTTNDFFGTESSIASQKGITVRNTGITGRIQISMNDGVDAAKSIYFTLSAVINIWYALGVTFVLSTGVVRIFFDGAYAATRTFSGSGFSDSKPVNLGRSDRDDRVFDGELAEWAVWDKVISDDDFAALGKGFRPIHIQPAHLVSYCPLVRDIVDVIDSIPSVTGTSVALHPRMIG